MPWKEGVTAEAVNQYRAIVATARNLDEQIDAGQTTPDEAANALAQALADYKPKKKEKANA